MHVDTFNKLREIGLGFKSYKEMKSMYKDLIKKIGEERATILVKKLNKFEGMPLTDIILEKIYYLLLSHGVKDTYYDAKHGHLMFGKEGNEPSPYEYVYLDVCYICEKIGLVSSGTGCCYECDKPHDKKHDEVQTKLWGEGMTEQQIWEKEYYITEYECPDT